MNACTKYLSVGSTCDFFQADYANNNIRRVFVNGSISSVAGTTQSGYTGDGGSCLVSNDSIVRNSIRAICGRLSNARSALQPDCCVLGWRVTMDV